ncbi:MAG: ethanolamine utilization protein EutP [Thermoanaerobacteraceae bacterium]|nr:ethanolamine utilization protein EutP [Thermoanaerobacteraceae bacterium]
MRKKIIFIGASGAGKTTLIKAISGTGEAKKTQALTFQDGFIDIPGEYMDIRRLNYAVITAAMGAHAIFVVQDSTGSKPTTPPEFCTMFNIPVFGIITKIDSPLANIDKAKKNLQLCGVKGDCYPVSSVTKEGIEAIKELIESI